eukprot:2132479-Pleurochrysis_carterae.AAC.2
MAALSATHRRGHGYRPRLRVLDRRDPHNDPLVVVAGRARLHHPFQRSPRQVSAAVESPASRVAQLSAAQ